ncbi:MAG: hypothetical protein E7573_01185 [Ruminococcaceae bacterium]|nr:hypothetical protein [Oscillospiraceae bacterium]MBR3598160.1 hypothetical protein [Clostridia bacterium]
MLNHNEDSDMKIVGKSQITKEDAFDVIQLIEETKLQRFNGNSAKAKALGANIVSAFSYKAAPDELVQLAKEHNVSITDDVLLQMKILSVFSAEYCLDNFLPSPMLSTAAVGELYDVLQELSPEFYEELSKSTAFSFYYLCLKKCSEEEDRLIGEQFACACGKKGDKAYESLGTDLHNINVKVYKKAIHGFHFV